MFGVFILITLPVSSYFAERPQLSKSLIRSYLVKRPGGNDGGSRRIMQSGGDEVDGRRGRRGDVTRRWHLSRQLLLEPVHLRLHLLHLGVGQVRHLQSRLRHYRIRHSELEFASLAA